MIINCSSLAQCLPGSFSATGLEPCETCPIGQYQPTYAQQGCTPCPAGTTTHRRGVRSQQECKRKDIELRIFMIKLNRSNSVVYLFE